MVDEATVYALQAALIHINYILKGKVFLKNLSSSNK